MRVLITGIAGFAGSHLAEYALAKEGVKLFGIDLPQVSADNIAQIKDKIKFFGCDIKDSKTLKAVIKEVAPERIFHLAAQSFVPLSWDLPVQTLSTNIIGEANLFEAARETGINPLIQIACSSEEYGAVDKRYLPVKEDAPLNPLSPYAVSKVAQDFLGYQYYKTYGLRIIRTRAFNHSGSRRGKNFVISNFARQIALIEAGKNSPILYTGNLQAIRDFTDVRDMVQAYWLALEKGSPGEVYNISSGIGRSIKEMLDLLLTLTDVQIEVKQEQLRLRLSDVEVLIGDSAKFRKLTGWAPRIPFKKTLQDLLNYWRQKIKTKSILK